VIEGGFLPIGGIVAGAAIRAKLALVSIPGAVAGITILGRRGEIGRRTRARMTLHAGRLRMSAFQLEGKTGVAESLAKTIHAVVTVETGRSISLDMRRGEDRVNLTVATVTSIGCERLDAILMTIGTSKRCARDS